MHVVTLRCMVPRGCCKRQGSWYAPAVTTVDVTYQYSTPPRESSVLALANIREVYGIRRVDLDERAGTIHIEYDATRLTEPVVRQLLRRAGVQLRAAAAPDSVVDEAAEAAAL